MTNTKQIRTEPIKNEWALRLIAASETKQSEKKCAKENYHLCTNFVRFGSAIYWVSPVQFEVEKAEDEEMRFTFIDRMECMRVSVCVCAKVIIRETISHHFSMDKHCDFVHRICVHSTFFRLPGTNQLLYYSTNTPASIDYIAKTSVCGGAAEVVEAAAAAEVRVFAINVLYLLCV